MLRFTRGDSGGTVVARTLALREDPPVVGEAQVVDTWILRRLPSMLSTTFSRVRGPVITSSDVAEDRDCTTETARRKLTELHAQGEVDKRTTGRTTVWWLTGGERITPGERESTEDTERERVQREQHREDKDEGDTTHADTPEEDKTVPTSMGGDSDTGTTADNSGVYDLTDEFE